MNFVYNFSTTTIVVPLKCGLDMRNAIANMSCASDVFLVSPTFKLEHVCKFDHNIP